MLMRIKNVKYVDGYKLKILFSDKKIKIIDFKDWIDEETEYLLPLKDLQFFKKVSMDEFDYGICWPNGADFSPDVLYEVGQDVKKAPIRCIKETACAMSRKAPKKK